jgi:restriction endonuclease Mrr
MWDDWYRNTKAGEMTPTEFEQYCKEILERFAQKENLQDFVILHDVHLESNDGNYQIDVFAEFRALGVSFKVLCECKQYKNRVSREKVAVLESKVRSLGAQKGILLSTAKFQKGAVQYAEKHGIALVEVSKLDVNPVCYVSQAFRSYEE